MSSSNDNFGKGLLLADFPSLTQWQVEEELSRVLASLDSVYEPRRIPRNLMLPGLIDLFRENEINFERLLERFNSAPRYYSHHLLQLCVQSKLFSINDLVAAHFDRDQYRFTSGVLYPVWLCFRGFDEGKTVYEDLSVPVFEFQFPREKCEANFSSTSESKREISFKIDIPGFAGGRGCRRRISFTSSVDALTQDFQGHTKVRAKIRTFAREEESINVIEIEHATRSVFLVQKSASQFWALPQIEDKVLQTTVGVAGAVVREGTVESGIEIEEGNWARFDLDVTKFLGGIASVVKKVGDMPPISPTMQIQSESLSKFRIGFKHPVGKLYNLFGPTDDSLRLVAEAQEA